MPKVHHRKARKDYPEHGISKGDMYFYTKMKTGPYSSRVLRQKEPFKPSQLTSSPFLKGLYAWHENKETVSCVDDLDDVIEELRSLCDTVQESFDNLPESLQYSSTGELLEERINACNEAIDELEQIKSDWEDNLTSPVDEREDEQVFCDQALNVDVHV